MKVCFIEYKQPHNTKWFRSRIVTSGEASALMLEAWRNGNAVKKYIMHKGDVKQVANIESKSHIGGSLKSFDRI